MLNLIINSADAIKDIDGDGAMGQITVTTRKLAQEIELTVNDNGCGLDKEIQGRVFEPFYTTKDVGKGTGQGLAIVYDFVVNKHGGTIVCDSTLGQGTSFTIKVPAIINEG